MRHPNNLRRKLLIPMLLAACAAHAADKPQEATFGKGKAGGALLTREQLRACLSQQAQAQQLDAELAKLQAGLNTEKAALVKSGETLAEQGNALDRTKPELVEAYNEQVLARDKAIDELQARGAQFNTRVEAAKAQREALAKSCDGRSYLESDAMAIEKGK